MENALEKPVGLYVHVPFCEQKCPYCDFYSLCGDEEIKASYIDTVIESFSQYQDCGICADTLYFGGGTPSLLAPGLLDKVITAAKAQFHLDGEITMEANPGTVSLQQLHSYRTQGVNRISFGVQSLLDPELKLLGRRHNAAQAREAVVLAKQAGFTNLSIDLMLGTPLQDRDSVRRTISLASELDIQHISAYLLKTEPGTPFYNPEIQKLLPDEDTVCAIYQDTCTALERLGFHQYEISNFAKPGYKSRHNLKYWRCEDYLGFGPSAHSFFRGNRFYCPGNLEDYLKSHGTNHIHEPVSDDPAADYIMLGLRLEEGISLKKLEQEYRRNSKTVLERAAKYIRLGYVEQAEDTLKLTPKGYLISNSIFSDLI